MSTSTYQAMYEFQTTTRQQIALRRKGIVGAIVFGLIAVILLVIMFKIPDSAPGTLYGACVAFALAVCSYLLVIPYEMACSKEINEKLAEHHAASVKRRAERHLRMRERSEYEALQAERLLVKERLQKGILICLLIQNRWARRFFQSNEDLERAFCALIDYAAPSTSVFFLPDPIDRIIGPEDPEPAPRRRK